MTRRTSLSSLVVLAMLVGCGSTPHPNAQATTAPTARVAPAAGAKAAAPASPAASSPRVAAGPAAQPGPGVAMPEIALQPIVRADQPVHLTNADDGSGRLFIVEKKGRIVISRGDDSAPTEFLNISSLVNSQGSEQGLLSVAFHPRFATNGLFFVYYIDRVGIGNSVVARYQVSAADPNRADPASGKTILYVEQPATNHNGGLIKFGPDGNLYVGLGDGGGANDRFRTGQNKGSLLAKILRLDVDSADPYGIPPDNPFVNEPDARPETYTWGLRNPWRFSWDRATGDLYIADVGQNQWEWVHLQRAGTPAGQNYGWPLVEGSRCSAAGSDCDTSSFIKPVAEYSHAEGCSITGGYVYRGPSYAALAGIYFFADYCSGRLWGLREQSPDQWQQQELLRSNMRASSFGEDEAGELYITSISDGTVYRLTTAT